MSRKSFGKLLVDPQVRLLIVGAMAAEAVLVEERNDDLPITGAVALIRRLLDLAVGWSNSQHTAIAQTTTHSRAQQSITA